MKKTLSISMVTAVLISSLAPLGNVGYAAVSFAPHINQASTQSDTVNVGESIHFTAIYDGPISNGSINTGTLDATDISTSGSTAAGIVIQSITETGSMDGRTFDIVATAASSGNVTLSIPMFYTTFATTGDGPTDLAIDTTGNVYTINDSDDTINKITPLGETSILATLPSTPHYITIDPSGNIYVEYRESDIADSTIAKITPLGAVTTFATLEFPMSYMTSDNTGNLYVLSETNRRIITKITPLGAISTFATISDSLENRLSVDSEGNVYGVYVNYALLSTNDSVVIKITPLGAVSTLATLPATVKIHTVDTNGNLYVANEEDDTIIKITPLGAVSTLATLPLSSDDIQVDSSGNVYSLNRERNTITKVTPVGLVTPFGSTLGDSSHDMAISPSGDIYLPIRDLDIVTKVTSLDATKGVLDASNSMFSYLSYSTDNTVTVVARPSAPTAITATSGSGQATVAFTPGSAGDSPITEYIVTSSGGAITATGTASPITVTGLTNGSGYTFTVEAISALGTGTTSAQSNSIIVGTPSTPTIGTATAGNAQASVAFTAPTSSGASAITQYIVTSAPGNITATGTASPITVTGLTNGTAYTFTVQAINAIGTGSASAASNSVTPAVPVSSGGGGGGGGGGSSSSSSSVPTTTTTPVATPVVTTLSGVTTVQVPTVALSGSQILFTDITNNWAKSYVEQLVKKGVINNTKKFSPDQSISRAEFLKIALKGLGITPTSTSTRSVLSDITDTSIIPLANKALELKIISGKKGTGANADKLFFSPNVAITRTDAVVMLMRAMGFNPPQTVAPVVSKFADVSDKEIIPYLNQALELGIISGQKGTGANANKLFFRPTDTISRAESAKIIVGVMNMPKTK